MKRKPGRPPKVKAEIPEEPKPPMWVQVEFKPGTVCLIAIEKVQEKLKEYNIADNDFISAIQQLGWKNLAMYAFWNKTAGGLPSEYEEAWKTAKFTLV
jgi:hypothetical protein